MLVSSGSLPADSDRYAFEVKWDGYRALIDAGPESVTVWSRNGNLLTSRYPEIQGLAGALSCRVMLDGEIVAVDENGKPDFGSEPAVHRKAPTASWPSMSCGSMTRT
jgi:bifunctional non-homologous end joining protein LigD